MRPCLLLPLVLPACSAPAFLDAVSAPTPRTLWAERGEGELIIRHGDDHFATYRYALDTLPVIFPLHAPGGVPITRSYPMADAPNEARDHAHQRSLWFTHGDVNGVDFWHDGAQRPGKIVHTGRLTEVLPRGSTLHVRMELDWRDPQGTTLLRELRTTRFGVGVDERWIDFTIELTAVAEKVTFGDTKEGCFAIRSHPELRVQGEVARGKARNSEGVEGSDVWGKRAAWVHYQGAVDGKPVGFGMFEHPTNFRHPTWWHARDYGLVAANPFGVHDFEGEPAGTGDHSLARGETLTLRYRLWLHAGERSAEQVAQAFETYRSVDR